MLAGHQTLFRVVVVHVATVVDPRAVLLLALTTSHADLCAIDTALVVGRARGVVLVGHCAMLDEHVKALDLLVLGGVVDRTLAVLVQREAGSVTEQPSHGCQVATGGGEMEWCGAVTVSQIWVDSLVFHLE